MTLDSLVLPLLVDLYFLVLEALFSLLLESFFDAFDLPSSKDDFRTVFPKEGL